MGRINRLNMKKALYYLRRNGWSATWYAAKERMGEGKQEPYQYTAPPQQELERQRQEVTVQAGQEVAAGTGQTEPGTTPYRGRISIVVPVYRTEEIYLRELITSVLQQTYPYWELILADASEDARISAVLEAAAESYADGRIRYVRLEENRGIAENTNLALTYVSGEYTGLLDHDDMLTPDALYETAARIAQGGKIFYSDEDKCNEDGTQYFEPNFKEGFNLDLLLSNNYICHFLVMESELMKELGFRASYDGAQDYDLILRAVERFLDREDQIVHIPRVLYHWRCHTASTAGNPGSKDYAYEAGRRAVQDFADRHGWGAEAVSMKHLGFYQLSYPAGPLRNRTDLGAVGGRILVKGKTAGGRMSGDGALYYLGLPAVYSGYLHRAVLAQDAEAVDIRCIRVREECIPIFEKITGVSYQEAPGTAVFDASTLPPEIDCREVSVALGKAIREAGYRILYLPAMTVRWK